MRSWRAFARLLVAGGVGATLGALVWLWGNAARGPIAYRPDAFIVPASLAGIFAGIGIDLFEGIQARDAKMSASRVGPLAAGGAVAVGLLCGAAFALVGSLIRPPADPLYLRLILMVAVVGLGLAAGALIGMRRGARTLFGALATVGLGVLWGLAVSLGVGVVFAVMYHPCPLREYCLDLGRWHGLSAALDQLSVASLALGIITALSAEVALVLLPRRAA